MKTVQYDICLNDCILFRQEFVNLIHIPTCGIKRETGKAARCFIYLPLKPQLERLFGNVNMAAVLQSHACITSTLGRVIQALHQSSAWLEAYSEEYYLKVTQGEFP